MNVIGLIGFSKHLFNSLFGSPVLTQNIVYDINKRECIVFVFLLGNLILLNLITLYS